MIGRRLAGLVSSLVLTAAGCPTPERGGSGPMDDPTRGYLPLEIRGDFVSGPGALDLMRFEAEDCEGCPMDVSVSGTSGVRVVERMDQACTSGGVVAIVKLFDDVDSVALRCRIGGGAGMYHERLHILHVRDGRIATLLEADMGFHEEPTAAEAADGACPAEPAGWMKVVSRGVRPVIEVLEATSADMYDGQGTAPVVVWTWDPNAGQLVRTAEARVEPYDMRRACRDPSDRE